MYSVVTQKLLKLVVSLCLFIPLMAIGKTWQVNLQQADIGIFIRQVAEMTDRSFIVDPRVKGKVTVISNASLDEDAVFRLFLSVLTVHGYAVLESPEGFKILPQNIAKQGGLNFDPSGGAPGELMVTRVLAIKNAVASELVPILRPLIPQYGHLAAVPTMNALIISDHADNIRSLEDLVERLDSTNEGEMTVVALKHAWAGDVITLLQQLTTTTTGKGARSSDVTTIVADERTNRLILKGKPGELNQIKDLIIKLDIPAEKSSRLQYIPLQYADATKVADLLKGVVGDIEKKEGSAPVLTTNIQADTDLNALLINAEPGVMTEIYSVLQRIDVPRAQVLIEAVIVEITVTDTEELGVQWLIGGNDGLNSGTNFTTAGTSVSSIVTSVGSNGTNSLATGGTAILGDTNLGAIIQALQSKSNSNLLSTPKILTLDNQEARILVGETRPFQTGEYSESSSSTFVTTSREDVGLTLKVTPHINSGNEVKMEVFQTVESASDEASSLGTITTVREVETVVIAGDRQTIVLGGLIQDNITESKQKVPFLGDIPFVGALFRSSSFTIDKKNLLVFIRPTIIRGKANADSVTNTQYQGFRAVELQMSAPREGGIEGLFEPELSDE
ncbi:MAG: type II secretion system secretin GspD [Marinomonas sp.]|uniref:type II secretion system secretin GspD n=1 Tax=unclassified Marinomonas TaxID=196814 RepID=UPI0007AFD517|nr:MULTISPECIES: type II secretion system secretin GspD [unclassified Marinomonas]KZM45777.1 general secretion pathway protein GspD [Marinomonas sp. SBI22]KZM46295.1 general secretion pathway protein GspD [Marinomonas sp. SBI8L]